jgi:non-ribosomal peptide synthetase component F
MRLLHQLFQVQAAKTPEATAVVYQDQTLSYRQLDQAADALACRLQAEGVGPGALGWRRSRRSQTQPADQGLKL